MQCAGEGGHTQQVLMNLVEGHVLPAAPLWEAAAEKGRDFGSWN